MVQSIIKHIVPTRDNLELVSTVFYHYRYLILYCP